MKKILIAVFALATTGVFAQQEVEAVDAMTQVEQKAEEVIQKIEGNAQAAAETPKTRYVPTYTPPNGYINLSLATQKIEYPGELAYKSKNGYSLEFGNTFFFNGRRPVHTSAGDIRFGLDWSFLDLTYATYEIEDPDGLESMKSHFANVGMQIGPSVTFTPLDRLNVKLYGHYAPSFAAFTLYGFDEVTYGYAGYLTGGLNVSYSFVSLGVEVRGATTKLDKIDVESAGEEDWTFDPEKATVKLPGMRFTLGFRF
jgi:hypothetical protein